VLRCATVDERVAFVAGSVCSESGVLPVRRRCPWQEKRRTRFDDPERTRVEILRTLGVPGIGERRRSRRFMGNMEEPRKPERGDEQAPSGPAPEALTVEDSPALLAKLEQEIAERRRIEAALRESEELYRRAFERSNDGIVITRGGRYLFINQPFLRTIGRREEELLHQPVGAFVHPEDRDRLTDITARRAAGEPAPSGYSLRIVRSDGAIVHVDVNVIEVVWFGEKVFFSNLRAATEKKRREDQLRESEEKYRLLVRHAPAGIYQVDFRARRFLDVNDVMCQYTGYTREEFLALDPAELLTAESLELFLKRLGDLTAGVPVSEEAEYRVRGKNAREFDVWFTAASSGRKGSRSARRPSPTTSPKGKGQSGRSAKARSGTERS